MIEDSEFLIVTHQDTVICVDTASGSIVHRPIWSCDPNLFFKWNEGLLDIAGICSVENASKETRRLIENVPIPVQFHDDGIQFGFKIDGKFACAETLDGTLTFSRQNFGEWERFKSISIVEFFQRKLALNDQSRVMLVRQQRKWRIPNNIHQIFITENEAPSTLPENLSQNIKNIQELNPQWRYILWTKKEIYDAIYDWFGFDMLEYYLKINPRYPSARADFFRYLCIYKMGGVYIDLKSGFSVPLSEIIQKDDQYILSRWNNEPNQTFAGSGLHQELSEFPGGEFQQWHVIAAPGHPFLEQVIRDVVLNINQYNKRVDGVGKMGVLRVTGPIAYTLAIRKILNFHEHRIIDAENSGINYAAVYSRPAMFRPHYSKMDDPIVI